MGKHRKFSIVCHNVRSDSRDYFIRYVRDARESTVSVEEYPDTPGNYHCHIFVEFPNPRSRMSVLRYFEKHTQVVQKPVNEDRAWGRVQVDIMYGTMNQAEQYLVNPLKDKPVGDSKRQRRCCTKCELREPYDWNDRCYRCYWGEEIIQEFEDEMKRDLMKNKYLFDTMEWNNDRKEAYTYNYIQHMKQYDLNELGIELYQVLCQQYHQANPFEFRWIPSCDLWHPGIERLQKHLQYCPEFQGEIDAMYNAIGGIVTKGLNYLRRKQTKRTFAKKILGWD